MPDIIFFKGRRVFSGEEYYWLKLSDFSVIMKHNAINKVVAILKRKDSDAVGDSFVSELDYDTFVQTYLEKSEELNTVSNLKKN